MDVVVVVIITTTVVVVVVIVQICLHRATTIAVQKVMRFGLLVLQMLMMGQRVIGRGKMLAIARWSRRRSRLMMLRYLWKGRPSVPCVSLSRPPTVCRMETVHRLLLIAAVVLIVGCTADGVGSSCRRCLLLRALTLAQMCLQTVTNLSDFLVLDTVQHLVQIHCHLGGNWAAEMAKI